MAADELIASGLWVIWFTLAVYCVLSVRYRG